jgi:hypothetical protein
METCSRCRGIRVHDPVETLFTIAWNTHLIEQRSAGGREVHVEPRIARKPASDGRGFVGTVIVHNQMYIELLRHRLFNCVKELQELLRSVSSMQFTDDFAGRDVECREQRGRAMTAVDMGAPLRHPRFPF